MRTPGLLNQAYKVRGKLKAAARGIRILALAAVGCLASNFVAAAPAVLLNKTVTVSYAISMPARSQDGKHLAAVGQRSRTIYISSAGRLFVQGVRDGGINRVTIHTGWKAAPGEGRNSFRFDGSRLVETSAQVSGAAQISITFAPSGQSCGAQVLFGRDSGRPYRWTGLDGRVYEATGRAEISGMRCAIQPGNAFAR